MWNQIADQISQVTGQPVQIAQRRSVGGGSINQAYVISGGTSAYFVKLNQASKVAMFEAEALGLKQMAASQTIRVPQPLCWGTAEQSAYLVLEWLDLGYGSDQSWATMGRNLAAMHRVTSDQGFGWLQNNTIGETPQINAWTESWLEFWTEHRLGYQFRLANRRGGHFPLQNQLLAALPDLLAGHEPQPSLVHGDLWSGNAAVTQPGEPVIFDPATYFGDREVDLAMTQLFGSFPANFYQAYQDAWPLPSGYAQRKILYNLYHILNHFNLFGGSYASQANQMIATLLKG
jgi:fructosamine-3-kinase